MNTDQSPHIFEARPYDPSTEPYRRLRDEDIQPQTPVLAGCRHAPSPRQTPNLREALVKNINVPYTTRSRLAAALDRHDQYTGPTDATPEAEILDQLISIAEHCCHPKANRLPDRDWAIAALIRHLTAHPHLTP